MLTRCLQIKVVTCPARNNEMWLIGYSIENVVIELVGTPNQFDTNVSDLSQCSN